MKAKLKSKEGDKPSELTFTFSKFANGNVAIALTSKSVSVISAEEFTERFEEIPEATTDQPAQQS